jgi:hypothetical protein
MALMTRERSDDKALQTKFATNVIRNTLWDEEAGEQILKILKSAKDPAMGISKAITMALYPVAEGLYEKQPDLDPAIWLSEGGVVDQIIAEIIEMAQAAGLSIEADEELIAQAKEDVVDDLKAMQQEMGVQ